MTYQLQVPTPCHENWDKMTPQDQGRHCNHCEKMVVDFTGMTAEEISAYLFTRQQQQVCGRFKATQLEQEYMEPDTYLLHVVRSGLSYIKRIAAVILFVFCITGDSYAQKSDNRKIVGKPVVINRQTSTPDTTKGHTIKHQPGKNLPGEVLPKEDHVVMGLVAMPPKHDTSTMVKGRVKVEKKQPKK